MATHANSFQTKFKLRWWLPGKWHVSLAKFVQFFCHGALRQVLVCNTFAVLCLDVKTENPGCGLSTFVQTKKSVHFPSPCAQIEKARVTPNHKTTNSFGKREGRLGSSETVNLRQPKTSLDDKVERAKIRGAFINGKGTRTRVHEKRENFEI